MIDKAQVAYQFIPAHMALPKKEKITVATVLSSLSQMRFLGEEVCDQRLQDSSLQGSSTSWVRPCHYRKLGKGVTSVHIAWENKTKQTKKQKTPQKHKKKPKTKTKKSVQSCVLNQWERKDSQMDNVLTLGSSFKPSPCCQCMKFVTRVSLFRILLSNYEAAPEEPYCLSPLLQSEDGNSGKYLQKTSA